jgi:hypothetical protein
MDSDHERDLNEHGNEPCGVVIRWEPLVLRKSELKINEFHSRSCCPVAGFERRKRGGGLYGTLVPLQWKLVRVGVYEILISGRVETGSREGQGEDCTSVFAIVAVVVVCRIRRWLCAGLYPTELRV